MKIEPQTWEKLSKLDKFELIWLLRWRYLRLPMPAAFALWASVFTFALLLIMPLHPVAIPAAFGGGLSFALILFTR